VFVIFESENLFSSQISNKLKAVSLSISHITLITDDVTPVDYWPL
jgi:hypothetical protein